MNFPSTELILSAACLTVGQIEIKYNTNLLTTNEFRLHIAEILSLFKIA